VACYLGLVRKLHVKRKSGIDLIGFDVMTTTRIIIVGADDCKNFEAGFTLNDMIIFTLLVCQLAIARTLSAQLS
jgi:hypothetical protein